MTAKLMTTETATRYFRTFASYQMPFVPEEELPFEETEGMRSYYVGRYEGDRLVKFAKIQLTRRGRTEFTLTTSRPASSSVYFEVAHPNGGPPELGHEASYSETRQSREYFEGTVGSDGVHGHASLFVRERAFLEEYEFWPNGHLRLRKQWKGAGDQIRPIIWNFDQSGELIEPEKESSAFEPFTTTQLSSLKAHLETVIPGLGTRASSETGVSIGGGSVVTKRTRTIAPVLTAWLHSHSELGLTLVLDTGDTRSIDANTPEHELATFLGEVIDNSQEEVEIRIESTPKRVERFAFA